MKNIRAYYQSVEHAIRKSAIFANPWGTISLLPDKDNSPYRGTIRTNNYLSLIWDAQVRFLEKIEIEPRTGNLDLKKYAYEYHEGNYFFRYERDIQNAFDVNNNPRMDHHEYHLHAVRETPRYLAPKIDLELFLKFVEASFKPED